MHLERCEVETHGLTIEGVAVTMEEGGRAVSKHVHSGDLRREGDKSAFSKMKR